MKMIIVLEADFQNSHLAHISSASFCLMKNVSNYW